ncbi:chromosome partitioning protein ParA [Vibrio rhodolitus]|uniref:chromosome partitioning protein ParA n=1 Tax=Vibrio rhodolitus TaxID=2231649 RepID=UPI000E0C569B|nr:chromosome partitioning protein ParA [Vibrio rhodolitus]
MEMKTTILATAVALALVGCGNNSNDSKNSDLAEKPVIAIPEQGKFIDAKVEGLYFVKGELSNTGSFTDEEGTFSIDQDNPNVTFILGNQAGGLVLGSSSGRHVVTPYETVGTHDRVVNLARLLLTINANTSLSNPSIIIPEAVRSPDSAMVALLSKIQLDDFNSASGKGAVEDLLKAIDNSWTIDDLVNEDEALTHFESEGSFGTLTNRGSNVLLTHWSKGSNWTFVERSSKQRVRYNGTDFKYIMHMDRTLGEDLFTQVTGLSAMYFKSTQAALLELTGSNDGSVTGNKMAEYLSCQESGGVPDIERQTDGTSIVTCDGEDFNQPISDSFTDLLSPGGHFEYSFVNPVSTLTEEKSHPWSDMTEFGGVYECMAASSCSEQAMTKYEKIRRNDANEGESPQMQSEITSGSYDPITDVYTQVRRKHEEWTGYVSESINFIYPVESKGTDRYVDFMGTWTMTKKDGASVESKEWQFTETGVIIDALETSYTEFAQMDFWWFGTNEAGDSKATLDQLNTTIRWDDKGNIKVNRFSYIPAGKNWDKGVLTIDTLNPSDGSKISSVTLQKNI